MLHFIFFEDRLLLKREKDGHMRVPDDVEIAENLTSDMKTHEVLLPTGEKVKATAIRDVIRENEEWMMVGLRASYDYITLSEYKSAGKAFQILYWDKHSRYCPVCGTATVQATAIMKKCPECGNELYPVISTAVIVLIRKGDEILLVHARNFCGTFYGLVAGFLESGETLEQCVEREVFEETGLRIKNIRYFASQPWPYPSGLMTGFIADYASGEIKLQDDELSAAAFYSRDNLPELPQKLSIARRLINWWLEETGNSSEHTASM